MQFPLVPQLVVGPLKVVLPPLLFVGQLSLKRSGETEKSGQIEHRKTASLPAGPGVPTNA